MIISKKRPSHSSMLVGKITSIMLAALLLSSCDNSAENNAHSKHSQQPLHRVEVVTVERKPVHLAQTVSGTLEAVTKIRLYNEESGRITKLPYHEGDTVRKGTLLVQLDNELLKTEVAKARAAKEQARVDYNRLKGLLPKKIATEEDVAKSRTVLDLAIADEKLQLIRLKRTSIKAPIDGLITKRFYEPGDQLAPLSHIHSIIDPSTLQLKAGLAERWIPLVNKDQPVKLRIDAFGDREYPARIARIHPTINANTHKGTVEIVLDPVPASAKVGQFARANIELRSSERLIIPVHTVHFEPEGTYVFRIVQDDTGTTVAEKVFFEQGQQFGAVTEILSGLEAGDKIVSRGYLGLRDGKKVKIANEKDFTASGNKPPTTKAITESSSSSGTSEHR